MWQKQSNFIGWKRPHFFGRRLAQSVLFASIWKAIIFEKKMAINYCGANRYACRKSRCLSGEGLFGFAMPVNHYRPRNWYMEMQAGIWPQRPTIHWLVVGHGGGAWKALLGRYKGFWDGCLNERKFEESPIIVISVACSSWCWEGLPKWVRTLLIGKSWVLWRWRFEGSLMYMGIIFPWDIRRKWLLFPDGEPTGDGKWISRQFGIFQYFRRSSNE